MFADATDICSPASPEATQTGPHLGQLFIWPFVSDQSAILWIGRRVDWPVLNTEPAIVEAQSTIYWLQVGHLESVQTPREPARTTAPLMTESSPVTSNNVFNASTPGNSTDTD
ncbi:hypothetical protein K440DRAFT_646767 [Wilcoxina mikolae CBS 423.85]|nr:hypothetical protein K440DRAFT_646767 [Wilcoxina mikolae CBS 423.85]